MVGPMDKSRYGKWGGWIAPLGLLLALFSVITAQPGFLSIACGGKTSYTAENNITWVTDADYIDVGESADIGDASKQAFGSYLLSLRVFPKPLNKSCYQLPLDNSNVPYLLRLWFAPRNFSGYQQLPSFAFSIETTDILAVQNVTTKRDFPSSYENIVVTSDYVMYICLVRTSETVDPYISGIELRRLEEGMYFGAMIGTMLATQDRYDLGGTSTVRYPQDKFDRIWTPSPYNHLDILRNVSSKEAISKGNATNLPPTTVMQTAWVVKSLVSFAILPESSKGPNKYVAFYFAEIETLNMSESRSFNCTVDGTEIQHVTLVRNYSLQVTVGGPLANFGLVEDANSTLPPIINAYEYYWTVDTELATFPQDINALENISYSFNILDWNSDPCFLIPWKGIGCENSYGLVRVSAIDLSGRNLMGSVPDKIAQLTAIVNMSLDNNDLMGPMPNVSPLTMLERLYLQNNHLNGTVEWLSELKNLKELNIENNNFNGVIPDHILLDCSLKLRYSGNPSLLMNKRVCPTKLETFHNSKRSNKIKLKVVLFSGILIIALALIVVVAMYRKKLRKKKGVATENRAVKKEPRSLLYSDYSMIMVPNQTKSRAFTLNEMIAATQSFSEEIGRGGFGSVFFGVLPEGKAIAVKVLSLFSRQGIHEFLNEVDLLSKINHRNLVSLLGYCNETREVMLIYEHMSGGSLRDHLYGPLAENSDLNWNLRLKIALDAAQGLEYLHVGSTPKIIHRDIKTANILLGNNLNGKLADFGLSRMTIDGEATHVTTAVKGTFGYLDPEYYNTQMLTEKSDVYSFGVVLLEIICGRQPIDIRLCEEHVNIVRWVTPYLVEMDENGGKITEIIDKRLRGAFDMKSMARVAKTAMRCVEAAPSCRPSVSEVVTELKEAIKVEDHNDSISVAEEIGIQNKREGMEWSDNSSNISKVGR